MVSWCHGLGEMKPPPAECNRRGCFGRAGSDHHVHRGKPPAAPRHHDTMSPCHLRLTFSSLWDEPVCSRRACSTQGTGELLRNSILISFVKKRCHGVMVAWTRGGETAT